MADQRRVEMVYAGAVNHDGTIGHAYYRITRGALDERAQLYPEPLGDFPPGAVCSYAVLSDGVQVLKDGVEFLRMWPEPDTVAEWTARHGALAASEAAWQAKDLPDAFVSLEPMRAAYRRLDEERQGVLIAQVVRYLVTDPT